MALTQLGSPYPVFTDLDGTPLDGGFVYIGVADDNPETAPILVYYDQELTQVAPQPLRTVNGYVMRNGAPAILYADATFSVTVRNRNGALVLYAGQSFGFVPGGGLRSQNNLSDVDSAATSLQNLGLTATADELNFSDGVTSNIQTQLDSKLTASDAPELTQAQAEDSTSTVMGRVSGQRLAQAQSYILLDRRDFSSSTAGPIDFTYDEDLYDEVVFTLGNLKSGSDSSSLRVQTSSDGGATFDGAASDYRTASGASSFVTIASPIGNASEEDGVSASISIMAPRISTRRTRIIASGVFTDNSNALINIDVRAERQEQAIVNGVRFSFSLGTFSGGTITMYGMKNS